MRAQLSIRGFSAANLCIPQTLMPFLYQTQTLCALQPLRHAAHRSFQDTPAQCRTLLHTSSLMSYRNSAPHGSDIPIRKVSVGKNESELVSGLRGRSADDGVVHRRVGARQAKKLEDVPWEDDLQSSEQERGALWTRRDSIPFDNAEHIDDGFSAYAEPFEEQSMFEEGAEDLDYQSEPNTRPLRDSTITIAERHAFQRIFADILARSKSSSVETDAKYSNHNGLPKNPARVKKANDRLNSVFDKAVKTASKTKPSAIHIANNSQQELQAAVDRYPPPLREAAAKAMGLVSERSTTSDTREEEEEIVTIENDLEHIRQPERERVEGLMRAAKTDIELWQVMESEVFSMVEKLGFGEKPSMQNTSKKPRGRKTKNQAAETSADHSQNKDQTQDLTTYGPLYPSHLLLGLRLLDRSFEKPSPWVLNVLPHIKSLGIISHVLGASTALYNELLRIYLFRHDDFHGAHDLLNEMDQAGLEFDAETLSIVSDIHSMQARVRRGDKGPVLQALWALPEFAPGRFKPWKDKIQASLAGRDPEGF